MQTLNSTFIRLVKCVACVVCHVRVIWVNTYIHRFKNLSLLPLHSPGNWPNWVNLLARIQSNQILLAEFKCF